VPWYLALKWVNIPSPDDKEEYAAFGGVRIGRGNRSTRRPPGSMPLCSPQNPREQSWDSTRAATVGSRLLTTGATALRVYVYCHVYECDSRRDFGLDFRFIDHLYMRMGTIINHSATANLHNSQITAVPGKPFPVCYVFTSRCLVTAYNSGDSSFSALKSSLNGGSLPTASFPHRLPVQN
jgi:hypothetical protein